MILYELNRFYNRRGLNQELVVYDKIKYHIDNGIPFEKLKPVYQQLMDWLYQNNLLSPYGIEIYKLGIDRDFALTSEMLTARGNRLLQKYYDKWLSTVDLNKGITDFSVLEKGLKDVSCIYRR